MADVIPFWKRRRWQVAGVALFLLPLFAALALPWWLNSPTGRRWLLARANRALAPGGLDFESIRLSWFGATRIKNIALIDPQGDRVIAAPEARWDRNLWQILFERPRFGTLLLDRANLDIERRADGTIDLYEALRPVLGKKPKLDLLILVEHGLLRFRSAGMPEPVLADDVDFRLHLAPSPRPLTWRLALANAQGTPLASSLEIDGKLERWSNRADGRHDCAVKVKGDRWPWSLKGERLGAVGTLHGTLAFERQAGKWAFSGDARLNGFHAAGPLLAQDLLHLEVVKGIWDVAESEGGWAVRRLDVVSSVGSIQAHGVLPDLGDGESRIEGKLDLAALAAQIPHALRLRDGIKLEQGSAEVHVKGQSKGGRQSWDAAAKLSDLRVRDRQRSFTLREPATVSARFARSAHRLDVESFGIETAFLKAKGQGDLDRGVVWNGTLDLDRLQGSLRDVVDFRQLELKGKGDVSGRYSRAGGLYQGTLSARLRELHIGGLPSSPLDRDSAEIELAIGGKASDSGLPSTLRTVSAGVKSGDLAANLAAAIRDDADLIDVTRLRVSSPYATLAATGTVSDPNGRRLADLRGQITPDWEAINSWLARRVEPGARVDGKPRAFQIKAPLTGTSVAGWLKEAEGEVGFDLVEAEFYGMRIGPASIVARNRGGTLVLDPIDTTINEGRLHLEPQLSWGEDQGAEVRLGPETSIKDARINDEVSHRVLSFVAPVLERATRVHGSVSLALERAVLPIGREAEQGAVVEGEVNFQDVEFVPGPLADDLLGLVGRQGRSSIKLREPVELKIADRRVTTKGLALPLGDVTRIEVEGWVDFDRKLALTASLPVTSTMVGNVDFLSGLVEGTRLSVPIRGTLGHPQIDKDAMKVGLKDLGRTLLNRTAGQGTAALLERMLRPRDPDAPPPAPRLTPEERRARRLERQAERRRKREEAKTPVPAK